MRMWTKGNPQTLMLGMQTGAATMENSMDISQRTKNTNNNVIGMCGYIKVFKLYVLIALISTLKKYKLNRYKTSKLVKL